jgi:hypothetical protein
MEFPPVSARGFMKSVQMAAALVVVVSLGACRGGGAPIPSVTSPTAQPPSPPPSPPPPTAGEITVTAIAPASGATLTLRDCSANGWQSICTEELRLAFDVVMDRSMPDATVTVGFHDGPLRCGESWLGSVKLDAGSRTPLSTSIVYVSYQVNEGGDSPKTTIQPCQLPATTTRMVIEVWDKANARVPVLTRDFANTYKFEQP